MTRSGGCGVLIAAVVLAVVVGAAAGVGGAYYWMQTATPDNGEATPIVSPRPAVSVVTDEDAIVSAVAAADPAVVKIVSTVVAQPSNPYEYFFGGPPRPQQGIGSGFIFDYEGRKLVLTNAHVVGNAQEIDVQTRAGETFKGSLLGADRALDAAVLELQGDGNVGELSSVVLGNSDELRIGEWVVAIGHPFAFDHTVTVGVVSALGERPLGSGRDAPVRNVIQTDAAINQGNSGGPLIDLAGNVIGINSMIFSPTGTSLGIGFAVPINDVREIVHIIIEGGPWVGIRTMPNSQGLSQYLGLQTDVGAVVMGVEPGGPAAAAGIREGDVILSIDGAQITNAEELSNRIIAHEIGDTIEMAVQRGAEQMALQVEAGRAPEGYFR